MNNRFHWFTKVLMVYFVIMFIIIGISIPAFLLGYFGEPNGSGDVGVNSPLSLSVPVFECVEGEHIIINGILSEQCTNHSQDAGQLYIPGGYHDNS